MTDDLTTIYQDIFHNIELNVVTFYREHPDLVDHQVDKIYEALQRTFEKELQGKKPPRLRWKGAEEELFMRLMALSELIMGNTLETEDGEPVELPVEPISKELLVKIFKRLRSSINLWSERGRRGYLDYIINFM